MLFSPNLNLRSHCKSLWGNVVSVRTLSVANNLSKQRWVSIGYLLPDVKTICSCPLLCASIRPCLKYKQMSKTNKFYGQFKYMHN